MRLRIGFIILCGISVLLLLFIIIERSLSVNNPLISSPSGYSLIADTQISSGEAFDFGVSFRNISQDQAITMHPITLPHGLPGHIQLQYQAILLPQEQAAGHANDILGGRGWPPKNPDGSILLTHVLEGFKLQPQTNATIVLKLVTDRPGTYIIGPITIHAEVSGILGIPFASSQFERTYTQFAVLCPQVSQEQCNQAKTDAKTIAKGYQ